MLLPLNTSSNRDLGIMMTVMVHPTESTEMIPHLGVDMKGGEGGAGEGDIKMDLSPHYCQG